MGSSLFPAVLLTEMIFGAQVTAQRIRRPAKAKIIRELNNLLDKEKSQIVYKFNKSSCEIQYCNENDSSVLDGEYWEKSSDGYYYYKKVLKQGQGLENGLISRVRFKPNNSEVVDFCDKKVQIAVKVESRQNKFEDMVYD